MKIYYNILQRVARTDKIAHPQSSRFEDVVEYWKEVNESRQSHENMMLYTHILTTSNKGSLYEFIKIKHKKIKEYVDAISSPWLLHSSVYPTFLKILYKSQKHYNAFAKLANIYRYKKKSSIENDLLLNPIDMCSPTTIEIYDDAKYVFTANDLITYIESSLSNTTNFFCAPLELRNPYNNIAFKKSTLYNIYFKIKSSSFLTPILFHYYFLCDFDLNLFALKYENVIREEYIQRLVYKSNESTTMKHMRLMIKNLTKYSIAVHEDFDQSECVKILRPYFYLYIVSRFHIEGLTIRWRAYKLLNRRLSDLFYYNPRFGRVYSRKIKGKRQMVNDLDHPRFTMNMCKYDLLYDTSYMDDADTMVLDDESDTLSESTE